MTNPMPAVEQLAKSKQRVTDHGEVFTPTHIVGTMLGLVKDESERIDSRFLEAKTSDLIRSALAT